MTLDGRFLAEAMLDAKVAVKVIDTRGNELMVVKTVGEAIRKG